MHALDIGVSEHAQGEPPRSIPGAAPEPAEVPARPLPGLIPAGRLVEISGDGSSARTTAAVSIVSHAQQQGELAAWIQPEGGTLYPPDLAEAGVDLGSLTCIHVPRRASPQGLVRAAERLLRSGAFGLVTVDLSEGAPGGEARWQGRLAGVLREHGARLVLLTHKPSDAPSLGPLVGVRIETRRERMGQERFVLRHAVLKTKGGPLRAAPASDTRRAPCGLP